jgi:hypothetical protein
MLVIVQQWLPIVLSAVLVFVASSVIHMVIKWHNSDYRPLPNEDQVRSAIRAGNPPPAQYVIPYCMGMKEMAAPEMQQKFVEGPIAFITLKPNGPPRMGGALGMWFAFILGVGVICAYVAGKTLVGETSFFQVCRLVGALSFLAYSAGSVQYAIWMGKPWPSVAKDIVDGVIYATLTALTFAWFWTR